jgi:hypothetical protein
VREVGRVAEALVDERLDHDMGARAARHTGMLVTAKPICQEFT